MRASENKAIVAEKALDSDVLEHAIRANEAGICVLPPKQDGSKRPDAASWTKYQSQRTTEEQIRSAYRGSRTGLGYVCGAISGGLELFDFDERSAYEEFTSRAADAGLAKLVARIENGYLERTPNGVHLFYRCTDTECKKLAQRHNEDGTIKALIETKGEGGFAIVAPSSGRVHPSGEPYILLSGGPESIVTITTKEREELHRVARSLDHPPQTKGKSHPSSQRVREEGNVRPGDDFNARVSWAEVLEGWTLRFERDGVSFWCRPGKASGISATVNHGGTDRFACFSTSTKFESVSERKATYDKFGAFAVLEHGGDLTAAARDLAAKGYGESPVISSSHATNEVKDWGECKPLPAQYDPVPDLPERLIPEPLRAWIGDAAERISIPPEFIATPAIVGAAAVVGRSIGILPKRQDDWIVVPNLWGAIVGPTGVMKSAAVGEGMRQVRRLAAASTDEFRKEKSDRGAEKAILEVRIAAVKTRGKSAAEKSNANLLKNCENELADLLRQQEECVATERRYTTQDSTVEKMGELLKENPRGILLLRDELAGWLRTLDRPGHEGEREFYLESWNGDGAFTYDRIGRGTLHIPALTLSVFGGIQPGKLKAYIAGALDHGKGDDGLIQRVQMLVWPDSIGGWRNVDRWPQSEARDRAFRVFEKLDNLDPEKMHARRIHPDAIPTLRFSEESQELFNTWRAELEGRLRGEQADQMPSFTGHLSKYRSLMPSLALLFHLIESVDQGTQGPVSLHVAQQAAAWCEYLEKHAQKIYAAEIRRGTPAAHRLAGQIKGKNILDGMAVREVIRAQ